MTVSVSMFRCLNVVAILLAVRMGTAQTRGGVLAPQPPMGWNSWDSYGLTITEAQFRANAEVLARDLKAFGYTYAVIDEGWFLKNPEEKKAAAFVYSLDANGRYVPVPERFPSALDGAGKNEGFRAIAASLHGMGLKFGIHIVRGIPRESTERNLPIGSSGFHARDAADTSDACPWDATNWGVRDNAAGQAWYDSLLRQYAAWGVDFLKVDCISDHPYKVAEIRMIHRAIVRSGRPIVLSLSPGPTSPGVAAEVAGVAQMWRISNDIWDYWENPRSFPASVKEQFPLAAAWSSWAHPGTWPDADMLPVGFLGPHSPQDSAQRMTRLTHDEQQTLLTLWCMARSPLILGANLTKLDDWTKQLATNRAVLALDQTGHDQRQVASEEGTVEWVSRDGKGTEYLSVSNLNDTAKTLERSYGFYGLAHRAYGSRELWSGAETPKGEMMRVTLAPHASVILQLLP